MAFVTIVGPVKTEPKTGEHENRKSSYYCYYYYYDNDEDGDDMTSDE